MAVNLAELKIDPLNRSPDQIRADQARQRTSGTGNVVFASDAGTQTHTPQFHSSYQNFLFSSAGEHNKPAWSDSTQGRFAIRLISRGLVGAAAFTIAGRVSRTQLMNYNPETFNWSWETFREKPLQLIANVFDVTFGKAIKTGVRGVSKLQQLGAAETEQAVWNATHFRTKAYYHTSPGLDTGRSLGAEMVAVSYDFAMASIGDATTRNFFQMIDPNIRKSWMVNDDGKMAKAGETSHFSLGAFAKSTGRATWRVLSKNQGEDWAVALPYVYQMKAQRGIMTSMFEKEMKGSKIVFDNGWNGGAFKVNNQGQIVGDYQLAGAADLHMRFVGYNIYTLMFREGYDRIGHALKTWGESGYSLQPHLPKEIHPIDASVRALRYVAKSTIKASMYMFPAVVPFWIMRAPQTKWRGAMINIEAGANVNAIASKVSLDERAREFANLEGKALDYGPLTIEQQAELEVMKSKMISPATSTEGAKFRYDTANRRIYPGGEIHEKTMIFGNDGSTPDPFYDPAHPENLHGDHVYDHFEPGLQKVVSKALNEPGKLSYKAGTFVYKLADQHFPKWLKDYMSMNEGHFTDPTKPPTTSWALQNFSRNFTDAALSYTPYMFAKAELGLRVDDSAGNGKPGKMDNAIYSLIDNSWALNGHGMWTAMKQIWNLSTHIERQLISREGGVIKPESVENAKPVQKIPSTVVQAEGRTRHDPVDLSRTEKSEDDKTSDTREPIKSWTATATRDAGARFTYTGNSTRH